MDIPESAVAVIGEIDAVNVDSFAQASSPTGDTAPCREGIFLTFINANNFPVLGTLKAKNSGPDGVLPDQPFTIQGNGGSGTRTTYVGPFPPKYYADESDRMNWEWTTVFSPGTLLVVVGELR